MAMIRRVSRKRRFEAYSTILAARLRGGGVFGLAGGKDDAGLEGDRPASLSVVCGDEWLRFDDHVCARTRSRCLIRLA